MSKSKNSKIKSNLISVIVVEKTGTLNSVTIKEYKEEDLYKKAGFKKPEGFIKQVDWNVKIEGQKYNVFVYAKLDGKANCENKYDFPPPVDNTLFFGKCVIVGKLNDEVIDLSLDLWNKIYEKLFGGFEDLTLTCLEDDDEEDELANIPKDKKTKKGGYLKDGFVVDSEEDEEEYESCSDSEEEEDDNENNKKINLQDNDDEIILEDIGSELSEEEYEYSDKEN